MYLDVWRVLGVRKRKTTLSEEKRYKICIYLSNVKRKWEILEQWDAGARTGSIWLRTGTGGSSRSGMRRHGLELCESGYGQAASSCECGNEHSGCIK